MAFRALRRPAAAIDEQHGASPTPAGADPADSRRRFLTRAATGGAVAIGATVIPMSSMVPAAFAQAADDETSGTTSGSTPGTTPAPTAPVSESALLDGADLEIVVFLETVEYAVISAYDTMVSTGKLAPAIAETARFFTLHHREHAKALAELAEDAATGIANPRLVAELTPLIENALNQTEEVTIAYNLEEKVTATYALALGQLQSWQAAALASRILPVDAQQAIAWSQVLYPDPSEWATQITRWIPNFQSSSDAIDIAGYSAS